MHIEFLVEEPSAEAALKNLLPKTLGGAVTFAIHPYQGKTDLMKKLPHRLKGYKHWLPANWRIVVLLDTNGDDCLELKAQLEQMARVAGLVTKSAANPGQQVQVLNRLAVEELEAWFFGDVEALHATYPRVSPTLGKRAKYRNPDSIAGGTWETLERLLQRLNYHQEGFPKITVARNISEHMDPARNRSRSFQVFRDGLLALMQ